MNLNDQVQSFWEQGPCGSGQAIVGELTPLSKEWFEKNLSQDNVEAGAGLPPRLKPEDASITEGQIPTFPIVKSPAIVYC